MPPRFQFARRKAAELIEANSIHAAPVPLDLIAEYLNAVIHQEPFDGELSGLVHRVAGETAIIGVNSMHSPARRRFTIAHELGHLVLHGDEELHIDDRSVIAFRDPNSSLAIDDREIEANQFAAALLMPEKFLRSDISSFSDEEPAEDVIKTLAIKYEVSVQAMTIRLSNLGMIV